MDAAVLALCPPDVGIEQHLQLGLLVLGVLCAIQPES